MASENNNTPRNLSLGIKAYIALVFIVLYFLYPKSSGDTGSFGDIFLSFFIALCVVVGLFAFFWWKTKKKITVDPEKKETKISSVPKKVTFWTDWKTYLMFFLVYVLWGIGQTLLITKGGPFHPAIAPLPSGMLYLPYSGIFYAVLLGLFFFLIVSLKNDIIVFLGGIIGFVCFFVSTFGYWFRPYDVVHTVNIPILHYIGITGIPFPTDPIVSWVWIAGGVFFVYMGLRSVTKNNSNVIGWIVLMLAVAIFLPQVWNLSPFFDLVCFVAFLFVILRST